MHPHPHRPIPELAAREAHELVTAGAALLDIREPDEWDEARIPGAVLKPLSTINDWWQGLPRDQDIVFQCRSGARSAQVVRALIEQAGFERVHNLAGGIIAWAAAGLPVETG